jgi:amino acid transporter
MEIANPKRSLPIGYFGGVLIAIAIYVLILMVVVGYLDFATVAKNSDRALSVAAEQFMGKAGSITIVIAALLATSSAINATFFGTGRLAYIIAKSGELPREFKRTYCRQHFEGTLITAGLALVVANFVPVDAIATMGSAGFLLLFMAVNIANCKLAKETGSRVWLSGLEALSTAIALIVLCVEVDENPVTRNHLWVRVGIIVLSLEIEIA